MPPEFEPVLTARWGDDEARTIDGYLKTGGYVQAGKVADLAVFDPATIADQATYEDPLLPPLGVHEVIVNGRAVVSGGQLTGALPGRVLEASPS
jgi:N-acyl-D-aspartate/D-glutamate deacylase